MKKYSNSKKAFLKASEVLVGGVNSPVRAFPSVGGDPIFFVKGKGQHLYDIDDNSFIDYVGSWGPAILGHAHQETTKKVQGVLSYGFSFGAPHESETELALLIRKAFPSMEKIRLVNSGTEATLSAIRLARGITKRDKIIKFRGCYHGHGDSFLIKAGSGALTLSLPDSPGVTSAVAQNTLIAEYNDFDSVKKLFRQHRNRIAAIIVEPVAGNMGLIPAIKKFLQSIKSLCKKHNTLLIFDEVMTGFRIAWGGAQEVYGIRADITCLGKIVGGGFPVAAYGGSKKIMGHLAPEGPIYQAGTLSGHPIAMNAGVSTLEFLQKNKNKVYSHLEKMGALLEKNLKDVISTKRYPIRLNRMGAMFTIFFNDRVVKNFQMAQHSDVKLYARFFQKLLKAGIYFPPSQFESCFISYAHDNKTIAKTLDGITKSLSEIFDE